MINKKFVSYGLIAFWKYFSSADSSEVIVENPLEDGDLRWRYFSSADSSEVIVENPLKDGGLRWRYFSSADSS
jgi:ABC-type sulfate transport system substrate-binding protein